MKQDQSARLEEQKWQVNARSLRGGICNKIAQVLRKSPASIEFTDYDQTKEISDRFAQRFKASKSLEVSNRSAAIELILSRLKDLSGRAFFLQDGYDLTGIIEVDLDEVLTNIDDILKSQHESLRVMTNDATAGACVTVEEGTAEEYPRHIVLWKYVA